MIVRLESLTYDIVVRPKSLTWHDRRAGKPDLRLREFRAGELACVSGGSGRGLLRPAPGLVCRLCRRFEGRSGPVLLDLLGEPGDLVKFVRGAETRARLDRQRQ